MSGTYPLKLISISTKHFQISTESSMESHDLTATSQSSKMAAETLSHAQIEITNSAGIAKETTTDAKSQKAKTVFYQGWLLH
jgi:hypothetical protein